MAIHPPETRCKGLIADIGMLFVNLHVGALMNA